MKDTRVTFLHLPLCLQECNRHHRRSTEITQASYELLY
jgi:hypothetical protein